MVDKVIELLHEYQDLFPTKFMELKWIIIDLGVLKITLKPDMKPVKKIPYRVNPKYKEKVNLELDKILTVGIIESIEESDWVSPMVVQENKQKDEIRICVEVYSFTDGFSGYHQIKITAKDRIKTTFTTERGCFQYTVMPFELKNAPAIFSRVVIAALKDFIHKFLEVYFDDWTVFGLVKRHAESLHLMLDTCQMY